MPVSDVCVKHSMREHKVKVCNIAYIPITYILIETSSIIKHRIHISHTAHVPISNILIEIIVITEH